MNANHAESISWATMIPTLRESLFAGGVLLSLLVTLWALFPDASLAAISRLLGLS
jgi:hypothetical protein